MSDLDWSYDDYDDVVHNTVVPDFDLERDNAKQIADAMLFAVLDGKDLYGAFEPACCETTVKVQNLPDIPSKSRLTYMSVNFNNSNSEWDPEISDLPYEHWATTSGIFSGTETTENMFVPFRADELGGVYNKMVYTAGELKALDMMSGGDGDAIEDLVGDLYDLDDVNLDAVMPITSENYSGRAMAAETKSHHEIYGVQTDLARVKVNFDNYNRDTFPHESAIDWSRILVSLKYLGVANMLYDKQRRDLLSKYEYTMYAAPPINSWPVLPKSSFIIPKIVVPRELAMASMSNFFKDAMTIFSSVDLYQLIMNRLDTVKEFSLKYTDMATDIYNAALRILAEKIERVKRANMFKITGYEELQTGVTTLRSEHEMKKAYLDNRKTSPSDIFNDVMHDKIDKLCRKDPNFAKSLFDYYEKCVNNAAWNLSFEDYELDEILHMFKLVTTEPYVTKMISIWNAIQPDYNKAVITITKYLSRIVHAPINMTADWPMSAGKKFVLDQPVVIVKMMMRCRNAKLSKLRAPEVVLTSYEPRKQIESIHTQSRNLVKKIALAWSERYEHQYERFKSKDKTNYNTIKYQILATAFKDLTYVLLMDTNGSYVISGTNPTINKIYSNYARKRSIKFSKISDAHNLLDLGAKIDNTLPSIPDLSFEDGCRLISERYDMVRNDILRFIRHGDSEGPEIPDNFEQAYIDSFTQVKEAVIEQPADTTFDLAAFMASLKTKMQPLYDPVTDTSSRDFKEEAKATFEDQEEADEYAIVFGYSNYEAWFKSEGRKAKKDHIISDRYMELSVKASLKKLEEQAHADPEDQYDLVN